MKDIPVSKKPFLKLHRMVFRTDKIERIKQQTDPTPDELGKEVKGF